MIERMKAILSIFPKFYKHLDVHGLATLVREVGLDTTNVIIRDGFCRLVVLCSNRWRLTAGNPGLVLRPACRIKPSFDLESTLFA